MLPDLSPSPPAPETMIHNSTMKPSAQGLKLETTSYRHAGRPKFSSFCAHGVKIPWLPNCSAVPVPPGMNQELSVDSTIISNHC